MTNGDVKRVRADLAEHVTKPDLTDALIERVIERVTKRGGTIGVAADAINMRPRPLWLELLIGPLPAESE